MFTLDTNVIIYYLRGDPEIVDFLENLISQSITLYISAVTEAELFSYSKLSEQDLFRIDQTLKAFSIIPLDSQLARLVGSLRRNYKIDTPDGTIAATALFTGTTLVTRNEKDFKKIENLKVKKI